jgi:large subunit ribosomal protein L29
MLKAKEIRELGDEEIRSRIDEEEDQLRQLRFQHAIAHIENPMLLREKRKLVARLRTIKNENEARVSEE